MDFHDEALSRVLRTARCFEAEFTANQLVNVYKRHYEAEFPMKELETTARTVDAWLRKAGDDVGIKRNEERKFYVEETVRSHLIECVRSKKNSVLIGVLTAFFFKLKKTYAEFGFKTGRALFLSFPELTTNNFGNFKINSNFVGIKGSNEDKDEVVPKGEVAKIEQAPKRCQGRTYVPPRRSSLSKEAPAPKRQRVEKRTVAVTEEEEEENQGNAMAVGGGGVQDEQREATEPEQQMIGGRQVNQVAGFPPTMAYGGFPYPQNPYGFAQYGGQMGYPVQGPYAMYAAPPPPCQFEQFGRHVASLLGGAAARGEDTVAMTRRILDVFNGGRADRPIAPVAPFPPY